MGAAASFDWTALALPAVLAFVATLSTCIAILATRRWHGRFTHDDFDGVQKFHDRPTPRIGGAAIAVGYLVAWPAVPSDLVAIWGLIGLAGLPALAVGLAEDLTRRVPVRLRLGATMTSGVLFALLTGYVMAQVNLPGVDWLLSFWLVAVAFTGFAMGGVSNAVNIIDGFHGLAGGSVLIMLAAFAWVAHQVGDQLVLGLALVYIGLVAGFFVVNFPRGTIFLGDGGAYFCGFLLASLGVLLPERNADVSAWTAILICGYPVIETLASIRRKARREGHSVGAPDRVHFHMLAHRYVARRLVPRHGPVHLRNPATSVVTWSIPLSTAGLAVIGYDDVLLCAVFFFLTAGLYALLYRIMALNPPRVPPALARPLRLPGNRVARGRPMP